MTTYNTFLRIIRDLRLGKIVAMPNKIKKIGSRYLGHRSYWGLRMDIHENDGTLYLATIESAWIVDTQDECPVPSEVAVAPWMEIDTARQKIDALLHIITEAEAIDPNAFNHLAPLTDSDIQKDPAINALDRVIRNVDVDSVPPYYLDSIMTNDKRLNGRTYLDTILRRRIIPDYTPQDDSKIVYPNAA